jgi:hypothetical protein
VPVPGTSYYNIQNKWHQNFLDVDKNNLVLSLNGQGISSIWALEPTHDANVFKIKNIQAGSYLVFDGKNIQLSTATNDLNSSWILEAP